MNTEELNEQLKEELNKRVNNINFEKVINLINQGANVNIQNNFGDTVLHIASNYKKFKKTVELINNADANVNLQNNNGVTVFHYVFYIKNDEKTIELLFNAGANVNLQNNDGKSSAFGNSVGISTALHFAIHYQYINYIQLLYLYHYHSIEQKLEYNISSHFAYHEYKNRIETLYNLFL